MAGGWEWIVILVVVILVFGIGRIGRIGGELGQGIREFRKGIRDGTADDDEKKDESESK